LKLNKEYTFFRAQFFSIKKQSVKKQLEELDVFVAILLSDGVYDKKLKTIKKIQMFWPKLEVEFKNIKSTSDVFSIPKEIPNNDQRRDLEEAIKDFDNGCYPSCLVMCRRAYEGALAIAYKKKTGDDPVHDVKCPNCKNTIRGNSYMGITCLHNWAMGEKLVTKRLKQVGFLIADLGAGGAHPPLEDFPNDPEIAKLGIDVTITALKQLYTNIK